MTSYNSTTKYTKLMSSSKRDQWIKNENSPVDDLDDDIVTLQSSDFESDKICPIWKDFSDGPFYRSFHVKHRQQMGPTCVSNVLAMITSHRPEEFQKPRCDLNTLCPVSWSDALRQHGKKLAYCGTDCRRLKGYLPELLTLGDLFVICYYTGMSDEHPECITADPDEHGDIIGSHIVVLHVDKIYDSAKYHGDGIDAQEYGEKYVKRIFRVVPVDYHRGL